MNVRRMAIGIALGASLLLAVGAGVASSQPFYGNGTLGPAWAGIDAMHDSPAMERMREQMGPELAAQCDAMHDQMQEQGGMMGDQGMMGDAALHESHHPEGSSWWST